ncbi:MAG TPA: hypothetical protein PKJ08_07370 [Candidatus Cloacimonadota bacterium]|nr:hypothetical protein [Candidatus Cloacimonadota bacterium]
MKKVLIITYYWPPCGGVAVQRWLKISKYLSLFEWLPTVITTENGDYPFLDDTLNNEISPDLKVIRTKTPTFKNIFKALTGKNESLPYGSLKASKEDSIIKKILFFIRSQMVIPDARVIWNKNALKAAEKAIFSGLYEAVITTGPPHSTHLVGLELKKKYKLTWIADFRDPWTNIYYYQSFKRNFLIKSIDRYLEKKVISQADSIVTVSEQIANLLAPGKALVIPNSFDPDDYINFRYEKSDKFRIKFIGSLTSSRKAEVYQTIRWLDHLASENRMCIEFSVIGNQTPFEKEIDPAHIFLKNIGFIQHKKVIEECVNCELLLLVINQTTSNEGILTYKLFEYLGSQTKIIGIGPVNGDAAKILDMANAGKMFDYHNQTDFSDFVKTIYKSWEENNLLRNKQELIQFSAPYIASLFSQALSSSVKKK